MELNEQISKLLDESSPPVVISLKGRWGVGKTFFWQTHIEKKLLSNDEKKYAYISLFGKSSIDEIKTIVSVKLSTWNNIIQHVKGLGRYKGLNPGSVLSLVEKKDFEGAIVCFDDLERLSNNIEIAELMGLISELKEEMKCKIVIISNIDQLEEKDVNNYIPIIRNTDDLPTKFYIGKTNTKVIYKSYSEKIIDYVFEYLPSVTDNFSLVKDQLNNFDSVFILELLTNIDLGNKNANIRLMTKFIRLLNIFSEIKIKTSDRVKNTISAHVFEKVYEIQIPGNVFTKVSNNKLKNLLNYYLDRGYMDNPEELSTFVEEIDVYFSQKAATEIFFTKVDEYSKKIEFDFSTSDYILKKEIYVLFKENMELSGRLLDIDRIANLLGVDINEKGFCTKTNKNSLLILEIIKLEIEGIIKNDNSYQFSGNNEKLKRLSICPTIERYIIEQKNKYRIHSNQLSEEGILKRINLIQDKRGWSKDDEEVLASISSKEHQKYMLKSAYYMEEIFYFARFTISFSGGEKPFIDTFNNILEALTDLSKKSKYKIKAGNLIQYLTNNLKEK